MRLASNPPVLGSSHPHPHVLIQANGETDAEHNEEANLHFQPTGLRSVRLLPNHQVAAVLLYQKFSYNIVNNVR